MGQSCPGLPTVRPAFAPAELGALDRGYKVTLIDSGNFSEESNLLTKKNYLFRTPSSIPDGVHRIGGGSTQWAGRISEFLVEDFRDWPLKKSDLETHYQTLYKFKR